MCLEVLFLFDSLALSYLFSTRCNNTKTHHLWKTLLVMHMSLQILSTGVQCPDIQRQTEYHSFPSTQATCKRCKCRTALLLVVLSLG